MYRFSITYVVNGYENSRFVNARTEKAAIRLFIENYESYGDKWDGSIIRTEMWVIG